MGLGNLTENVGEIISFDNLSLTDLPPNIISGIAGLVTILKAAGIIFIGYIVFLIIKGILTWRRNKRIDNTHKIVVEINRKLDILMTDKKKEKLKELEKLERELVKEKGKHEVKLKKKFLFKNLFKKFKK